MKRWFSGESDKKYKPKYALNVWNKKVIKAKNLGLQLRFKAGTRIKSTSVLTKIKNGQVKTVSVCV